MAEGGQYPAHASSNILHEWMTSRIKESLESNGVEVDKLAQNNQGGALRNSITKKSKKR